MAFGRAGTSAVEPLGKTSYAERSLSPQRDDVTEEAAAMFSEQGSGVVACPDLFPPRVPCQSSSRGTQQHTVHPHSQPEQLTPRSWR